MEGKGSCAGLINSMRVARRNGARYAMMGAEGRAGPETEISNQYRVAGDNAGGGRGMACGGQVEISCKFRGAVEFFCFNFRRGITRSKMRWRI